MPLLLVSTIVSLYVSRLFIVLPLSVVLLLCVMRVLYQVDGILSTLVAHHSGEDGDENDDEDCSCHCVALCLVVVSCMTPLYIYYRHKLLSRCYVRSYVTSGRASVHKSCVDKYLRRFLRAFCTV